MRTFIRHIIVCFCFFILAGNLSAQNVGINTDGTAADPSALLDVKSNNKGVLVPRMTQAERDAIASPATALLIYQTDASTGFYYFDGTVWKPVGSGPKFYNAVGTTNISRAYGSGTLNLMDEMSITFTPQSSVVYATFSSTGGISCPFYGQARTTFVFTRDGVQVGNRFMHEAINTDNVGIDYPPQSYHVSYTYPIAVTPGVSTTIDVRWAGFGNGNPSMTNNPASSNNHNRVLTIIDP